MQDQLLGILNLISVLVASLIQAAATLVASLIQAAATLAAGGASILSALLMMKSSEVDSSPRSEPSGGNFIVEMPEEALSRPLSSTAEPGPSYRPAVEDPGGSIFWADGSCRHFDKLFAGLAGDRLPYYWDTSELETPAVSSQVPKVKLCSVVKIDFLDLSEADTTVIRCVDPGRVIRKARITLKEGTVYNEVYTDTARWRWTGSQGSGNFNSPQVVGLSLPS